LVQQVNKMRRVNYRGTEINAREDTLDEYILTENGYDKCDFNENDTWLDAGGNIGVFVCKYAKKVFSVISFEPDKTNYELMIQNCKLNNITNHVLVNKALVDNDDKTRLFYLNMKKNKGSHSLYVTHGREEITVQCQNINEVIRRFDVNKLKIDTEGSEYELIKCIDFTKIDEIIYEHHFNILKDKDKSKYYELINILKDNKFEVNYNDNLNKPWTTIVHAKKQKL